ncbi:MAG: hypothetical protein ACRDCE_16750 [Cetobacterium sp.]|uniref:hypothetical protein n=1 Tax=Cetobacterium sp. TaxID=2071632 RepID=UPI003EE79A69
MREEVYRELEFIIEDRGDCYFAIANNGEIIGITERKDLNAFKLSMRKKLGYED